MATEVKVIDGPGELDFIASLLRGGEVEVRIANSDETKKLKIRIPKTELLEISGAEIELLPGKFVKLEKFFYGPRLRSGSVVLPAMEEHPLCGHTVLKGERYCSQCGRDRMDGE